MKKTLTISIALLIIAPAFGQKVNSSIDFDKGIILNSVCEPFISSQHKYDTCNNRQVICLIDGKIWFGNDLGLELPKNQLTKLSIRINGKDVALDVSGMYNPSLTGKLTKSQFKLETSGDIHTLYGYFSDGAGAYTAHWTIVKNKSLRQIITRDEREFYWQME